MVLDLSGYTIEIQKKFDSSRVFLY